MTVHYTKRAERALGHIAEYTLDECGPEQRDRYMAHVLHERQLPKKHL